MCQLNNFTSLDVTKNTELLQLYCGGNKLTTLDTRQNPDLRYLSIDNNNITSFDASNNNNVIAFSGNYNKFNIKTNPYKSFDLSALPGNFDTSKTYDWVGGYASARPGFMSDKLVGGINTKNLTLTGGRLDARIAHGIRDENTGYGIVVKNRQRNKIHRR